MVVMFLGLSDTCFSQSAKEAVTALLKFQIRLEATGMPSRRDYARDLGEALFEVKLFLLSKENKEREKPELVQAISKCVDHYRAVVDLFPQQYCKRPNCPDEQAFIEKQFPEIITQDPNRLPTVEENKAYWWNHSVAEANYAATQISLIRAVKELEKAVKLLSEK